MNEQLIVKNFGPIKDATVDFKRVTVFIGPTGGGKSTLAKLAAIFRDVDFYKLQTPEERENFFNAYSFKGFFNEAARICWSDLDKSLEITKSLEFSPDFAALNNRISEIAANKNFSKLQLSLGHIMFEHLTSDTGRDLDFKDDILTNKLFDLHPRAATRAIEVVKLLSEAHKQTNPIYIPSERGFTAAIEYSIAGLVRDDIGIPKILLDFTNSYSTSRREVSELPIPFLKVKYIHQEGKDLVQNGEDGVTLNLYQAASGVQSVTPMLVVVEKLCNTTGRPQSFIIEEPELNLFPNAQQGLLNLLVEKCIKSENDLTITTHSPYILSHLNLLLYAHHVGNKDEKKRQKVAAIIPEKYWVNPDEFAAYYVNGPEGAGGVRSLLDPETKLISQNELDAVSGIQADEFDQLLDINRGF